MIRRPAWLLLPLSALLLDWGSKSWILQSIPKGETREVIPGFFNLTLGFNEGAIFGSLTGLPEWVRFALFTVAGVAALFYFGHLFMRAATPTVERVALGLILGGAMGNGMDRLAHGHVVDFLDFVLAGWHYWTFNLADCFIVAGAILWGLQSLRGRAPEDAPAKS
ncbi:MAG TPA: signal peptidase II [Holophagaceae bacterium]|nr:signal peptidase II [Holophagaceae bacterium]